MVPTVVRILHAMTEPGASPDRRHGLPRVVGRPCALVAVVTPPPGVRTGTTFWMMTSMRRKPRRGAGPTTYLETVDAEEDGERGDGWERLAIVRVHLCMLVHACSQGARAGAGSRGPDAHAGKVLTETTWPRPKHRISVSCSLEKRKPDVHAIHGKRSLPMELMRHGAGRCSSWLAAMAPTAPTTSKRRRSTQTVEDVATMAVWQLMQYEA